MLGQKGFWYVCLLFTCSIYDVSPRAMAFLRVTKNLATTVKLFIMLKMEPIFALIILKADNSYKKMCFK